jgi:hypothetical protein
MKTTGYRGVLPFYAAALVWLLYCRFLPLYLPIHFLIVAALSFGAGFLLYLKLPAGDGEEPFPPSAEEIISLENEERKK